MQTFLLTCEEYLSTSYRHSRPSEWNSRDSRTPRENRNPRDARNNRDTRAPRGSNFSGNKRNAGQLKNPYKLSTTKNTSDVVVLTTLNPKSSRVLHLLIMTSVPTEREFVANRTTPKIIAKNRIQK